MSATNEKNDFALARKPTSAVEKVSPGSKRILASIVTEVLALAPSSSSIENLLIPCPKCGGQLETSKRIIVCQKCDFNLPRVFKGRRFAINEIEELLSTGTLGPLHGFRNDSGEPIFATVEFNGYLSYSGCGYGIGLRTGDGDEVDFSFPRGNPFKWYRRLVEMRAGDYTLSSSLGIKDDNVFELTLLAMSCKEGHGVKQNFSEAYKWFRLAVDQKSRNGADELQEFFMYITTEMDSLIQLMTAVEIAEGERRASEFRSQKNFGK